MNIRLSAVSAVVGKLYPEVMILCLEQKTGNVGTLSTPAMYRAGQHRCFGIMV